MNYWNPKYWPSLFGLLINSLRKTDTTPSNPGPPGNHEPPTPAEDAGPRLLSGGDPGDKFDAAFIAAEEGIESNCCHTVIGDGRNIKVITGIKMAPSKVILLDSSTWAVVNGLDGTNTVLHEASFKKNTPQGTPIIEPVLSTNSALVRIGVRPNMGNVEIRVLSEGTVHRSVIKDGCEDVLVSLKVGEVAKIFVYLDGEINSGFELTPASLNEIVHNPLESLVGAPPLASARTTGSSGEGLVSEATASLPG